MMTFVLIAGGMLVIAGAIFVLPLLGKSKVISTTSRDAINKEYYDYRLRELDSDIQQGVVADQEQLVKELQQNLLIDIPEQMQPQIIAKPVQLVPIVIGILLLLTITLFSYAKTGALSKVLTFQDAQADYTQLHSKYQLNQLSDAEAQQFALALRSRIVSGSENIDDLLALGEMGMRLNDYNIASQAFAHAYKLEPNNPLAQSFHGYITLMYAQSEREASLGFALLNKSLQQNPDNLFVIKALAFYSLESKDKEMMLYYWNMWLDKLPENSSSRTMVMSTLEHIKNNTIEP